jgi:hypothetical protein
MAKTWITELETELKNVKDELTLEFEKTMKVVDILNTEQLNKALQTQRDEMNVEFERRMQTQRHTPKNWNWKDRSSKWPWKRTRLQHSL